MIRETVAVVASLVCALTPALTSADQYACPCSADTYVQLSEGEPWSVQQVAAACEWLYPGDNRNVITDGSQNHTPWDIRNALFKFDLSGISGEVTNAILYLSCTWDRRTNNACTLTVHPVNVDWSEADACWADRTASQSWLGGGIEAGGNYDPVAAATIFHPAGINSGRFDFPANGPFEFTVTDMVNGWINGGLPNYGVVLMSHSDFGGGKRMDWCSRNGDPKRSTWWPQLVVYTGPLTSNDTNPPAAPSDLTVEAQTTSRCYLEWTDNATNETGFLIERKTGVGGAYAQVDSTFANTTSYSDEGLSPGTLYYYRVKAQNAHGDSAFCPEASATTQTTPVTAACIADSYVQLYEGVPLATPFGTDPWCLTYGDAGHSLYDVRNVLLKFDLSGISGEIADAVVRIRCASQKNTSLATFNMHAVLQDWTEADVTWVNRTAAQQWNDGLFESEGGSGNYDTNELCAVTNDDGIGIAGQWVEFPVTSLVDQWVNGGQANCGVVLRAFAEGYNNHTWDSRETANQPQLIVYTSAVQQADLWVTRMGLNETNLSVTCDATPGQVFTLLQSPRLIDPVWVTNSEIIAGGPTVTFDDPLASSNRPPTQFYKLTRQ